MWKANLGDFIALTTMRRHQQISEEIAKARPEDEEYYEYDGLTLEQLARDRHFLLGLRLPMNFPTVFDLTCYGIPIITQGGDRGLINIEGFWIRVSGGFEVVGLDRYLKYEQEICKLGTDLTGILDDIGTFLSTSRNVIRTTQPISGKEVVQNISRLLKVIERCRSQEMRRAEKTREKEETKDEGLDHNPDLKNTR
jgi:hypothetical protein